MKKIKYGMVGGGINSFIGNVHRNVLRLDPRVSLTCGCFSSNEKSNFECGKLYDIPDENIYPDWKTMAREEGKKGDDKIDFVTVCTPNHIHYAVCKEFLLNGINVVCEKPLCFEIEEAKELCRLAKEKNLLFAVTYTYTGYTMVKVLREIIKRGDIGEIISVNAQYAQDWLLDELQHDNEINENNWRTNPEFTGIANSVGDIGTHIENIVHYVTGLKIKRLCATIDRFGKKLDYNDSILVEYTNGVHGSYWCSQVAAGETNGLRFEIYGKKGSVVWEQTAPDNVKFTLNGEPTQTLTRGCSYINANSAGFSRLPAGHPEGFQTAFANLYKEIVNALEYKKEHGEVNFKDFDFRKAEDGLEGVRFVHAVIYSGDHNSEWVNYSDFE